MERRITIVVVPLGGLNLDVVDFLLNNLSDRIPFPNEILGSTAREHIPLTLFNPRRMQYNASLVNKYLAMVYRDLLRENIYLLGVSNADGYVEGLNFVFGVASRDFRVASVYTRRMKDEDSRVYMERVLKVSLHELGHLFGLSHCKRLDCVMRFSNSLDELDRKGSLFCSECSRRLLEYYRKGFI